MEHAALSNGGLFKEPALSGDRPGGESSAFLAYCLVLLWFALLYYTCTLLAARSSSISCREGLCLSYILLLVFIHAVALTAYC